jgi:hypothetical protein
MGLANRFMTSGVLFLLTLAHEPLTLGVAVAVVIEP